MESNAYQIRRLNQCPDCSVQINKISGEAWPEFLLHNDIQQWDLLFGMFAAYQILVCDAGNNVLAVGHCVPVVWDGTAVDLPTTIEAILQRAVEIHDKQLVPNTLSALALMVGKDYRNLGLSTVVIRAMKTLAGEYGLGAVIVPLRPTLKKQYPLIPLEDYARWRRDDGEPFDPWLRVHWRLGAIQLKVAPNTLTVTGTVADWEAWTGMRFPGNGRYIVPEALEPVIIDRENNRGRYEEPNIWLKHSV